MTLLEVLEDEIVKLIEQDQEHLIPETYYVDSEMFLAIYHDMGSEQRSKFWLNTWGPGYYILKIAGRTIKVEIDRNTQTVH